MSRKFEFSYPYAAYQDISLMRETHTKKELLAEYKKVQQEANRRLKQLGKIKWMRASKAYEDNIGKYDKNPNRFNKTQLAKLLREGSRFLAAQSSTVKGQRTSRQRLMYTLKEEWGLDFINRNNIRDFVDFLEAARENLGVGHYTMTEVEAMFMTAKSDSEKYDIKQIKDKFEEYRTKMKDDENFLKYKREAEARYNPDDYDW